MVGYLAVYSGGEMVELMAIQTAASKAFQKVELMVCVKVPCLAEMRVTATDVQWAV